MSKWVVDRCASPQILEISFQTAFPTSVVRTMSTSCCRVCFTSGFRVSCSRHGSVSMCEHLLATRGKCLSEQFCYVKFPEHMVFMFSFGVDDYSSHSAKRCLFRNEA